MKKYYYADEQKQPVGLYTLEEIKDLVASGKIPANPNVLAEGESEWKPLSALEAAEAGGSSGGGGGAPPPPPGGPPLKEKLKAVNSTLLGDAVAGLLSLASRALGPAMIGRCLNYARDFGHYVVLVGGALVLVYAVFQAIKLNSLEALFLGIAALAALAIAQFAAQKFLGAGQKLIESTQSRISSAAFLDCFALLALLAGVFALVSGIGSSIQLEDFSLALFGLLTAIFWTFVAALMLHPDLINIEVGESSAGEEAIGILTLFLKAGLKLVPLFFILLAAAGCLLVILGFTDRGGALASMVPFVDYGTPVGIAGAGVLVASCFVPLFAYILFLILYLIFDLVRAVLAIPGKLDQLKR